MSSTNGKNGHNGTGDAKLTLKQRLFVEAYLGKAKGNGVEAARMAGYKGDDLTLAVVSHENLRKPNIAALVAKRIEKATMSADQVLAELTEIATTDWKEFVEVVMRDGVVVDARLRLNDKIRALELVGKYHKLFTDKVDTEVKLNDVTSHTNEERADRVLKLIKPSKAA